MTTRPLSVPVITLKAKIVLGRSPLLAHQTLHKSQGPSGWFFSLAHLGRGQGILALVYYNFVDVPHLLPDRTMSLAGASPHEG